MMHQKKCNLQNKSDSQPGHLSKCANNWSQDYPVSAEGAQFHIESALLVPSEPGVEVLGFLVVILVDAHLAGVYSCVGFTGAVVGIEVSWGEVFAFLPCSLPGLGLEFPLDTPALKAGSRRKIRKSHASCHMDLANRQRCTLVESSQFPEPRGIRNGEVGTSRLQGAGRHQRH